MNRLNRYLLTILGLGWLSFLIAGIVINQVFAAPNLVLLIDRSYCPAPKWQQVVQDYTKFYRQHQQQRLKLEKVVLFSDLSEDVLSTPPTPKELGDLRTYGRSNLQRQVKLKQAHPQAKVLGCPQ